MSGEAQVDQIKGIRRVADMLCTAHAGLRDRYARLALLMDLANIGLSTWLVALGFVAPAIGASLTPFGWNPQIWIGTLGATLFFLAVAQMRTDWKGKSDAHRRALDSYAEVRREAGYLLATGEVDRDACQRVLSRRDMAASTAIEIPEADFLAQKRRHLMKVELSRALDASPGAWLWRLRARIWWRDNVQPAKRGERAP